MYNIIHTSNMATRDYPRFNDVAHAGVAVHVFVMTVFSRRAQYSISVPFQRYPMSRGLWDAEEWESLRSAY